MRRPVLASTSRAVARRIPALGVPVFGIPAFRIRAFRVSAFRVRARRVQAPLARALLAQVLLALTLLALPAAAITPDELLSDPGQEARAREISRELRCVVCQSESIDESNAEIARDLRLLVRERIVAGDTNAQVIDYVVDRYGEFVLFKPRMTAANAPLWFLGPVLLIFGLALVGAVLRRRARDAAAPHRELTAEEQARLDALLKE